MWCEKAFAQITRLGCSALIVLAYGCADAGANSDVVNIKCLANDPKVADVTITQLWSDKFQVLMYCIEAEFVSDITPCAPNHGYSESAMTGSANIVDIGYGTDFPYLASNVALRADVDEDKVTFSLTSADFDALIQVWKFQIDMARRAAVAEVGGQIVEYACSNS